jgi:hypothetical protein
MAAAERPDLGPQDFHQGPAAANRFRDLTRRILTTPKADLVKPESHKKPSKPGKKK